MPLALSYKFFDDCARCADAASVSNFVANPPDGLNVPRLGGGEAFGVEKDRPLPNPPGPTPALRLPPLKLRPPPKPPPPLAKVAGATTRHANKSKTRERDGRMRNIVNSSL